MSILNNVIHSLVISIWSNDIPFCIIFLCFPFTQFLTYLKFLSSLCFWCWSGTVSSPLAILYIFCNQKRVLSLRKKVNRHYICLVLIYFIILFSSSTFSAPTILLSPLTLSFSLHIDGCLAVLKQYGPYLIEQLPDFASGLAISEAVSQQCQHTEFYFGFE